MAGDLVTDLAAALGVPTDEAAREIEDAGFRPAAQGFCPHCNWPTWEHLPGEIRRDGCPYDGRDDDT